MNKDTSILSLISALGLPQRGWTVVAPDPWEADRVAIGIGRSDQPRRLVYISTFERAPGRFDYQCESPTGPAPTDYRVVDEGEDVGFSDLVSAMTRHLSGREQS